MFMYTPFVYQTVLESGYCGRMKIEIVSDFETCLLYISH